MDAPPGKPRPKFDFEAFYRKNGWRHGDDPIERAHRSNQEWYLKQGGTLWDWYTELEPKPELSLPEQRARWAATLRLREAAPGHLDDEGKNAWVEKALRELYP